MWCYLVWMYVPIWMVRVYDVGVLGDEYKRVLGSCMLEVAIWDRMVALLHLGGREDG